MRIFDVENKQFSPKTSMNDLNDLELIDIFEILL